MPVVQQFSRENRPRRKAQADWRHLWRRAQATFNLWAGRLMAGRLTTQAEVLGDHIGRGETVLDVGCETGHLCKYLAEMHGATVTGIDVHDARTIPIDFRIFDGESIPFADNAFDHVVLSFVLHHSNDPMALIKECRRVARRTVIAFEDFPETRFERMSTSIHVWIFNVIWRLESGGDYRAALRWLGDNAAKVVETPLPRLDWMDSLYRVPHAMLAYQLPDD
jgi:2-polyprenyl-3-methyl-5-hydroxy-6-metoxy-1,4-benzoquinol methylase